MKDEEEIYREIDKAIPLLEETFHAMKLKKLNPERLNTEWHIVDRDIENIKAAIAFLFVAQKDRIPF